MVGDRVEGAHAGGIGTAVHDSPFAPLPPAAGFDAVGEVEDHRQEPSSAARLPALTRGVAIGGVLALVVLVGSLIALLSGGPSKRAGLTPTQLHGAWAGAAVAGQAAIASSGAPITPSTLPPQPTTTAPPVTSVAPLVTTPVVPSTTSQTAPISRAPAAAPAGPAVSATPASVPAQVASVARGIIYAVDVRSGGRYRIAATADNVSLLARWMANEGGLWADNPLNTSLDAGSYPHQFTSAGVDSGSPIFPSMAVGIRNTASTLLLPAYGKILAVLARGNAPCTVFATAVIRSPWAASHYGYDPGAFCNAAPSGSLKPGHRGHRGGGHPRHSRPLRTKTHQG